MTVTNNYLTKQELASQKVPGSKAVELTGFDDKLNPVYGARLLATEINADSEYIRKTFGSVFVKDNVDNNSTYIKHSGDASFLFDKQGERVASWAWNTLDISIPKTIEPALEIVKSALTPIKNLLEIIKEAISILVTISINISEALRVLLEEVINVLINALEWFNIEVSLHALFVPPLVPTVSRPGISSYVDISKSIINGASNAVSLLNPDLGSKLKTAAEVSQAGNAGFYSKVISKLDDKTDTNRPQFKDNNYVAGCTIILGYPIEQLYNVYYKLLDVFNNPHKPIHNKSIKPVSVSYIHYIKSLDIISLEVVNPNKNKFINFSATLEFKRRLHYLVLYTDKAAYSSVVDATSLISSLVKESLVFEDLPKAYITNSEHVDILVSDVQYSDVFDIIDFSVNKSLPSGTSYKYSLYTFQEYFNTATKKLEVDLIKGSSGILNVPVYGKLEVAYGIGKYPQWLQVSSMFDLIAPLAVIRDFFGLVRKYINTFFSRVASQLNSILEELTKYLNFVARLLDNVNRILDILKTLSGLGIGGSILMFQGEGGNSTIRKILKDSLIDQPAKLYSKAEYDVSRPPLDTMSLEHSNWNKSKRDSKKYYSSLARQFDSLSFSSDTYSYAGSFPPNFEKNESVAGLVLAAGGDSIDAISKIYSLLKAIFSPDSESTDSDEDFALDIEEALGSSVDVAIVPSAVDISKAEELYPESIDNAGAVIPGAYTQALEATNNPNEMLEDFCRN